MPPQPAAQIEYTRRAAVAQHRDDSRDPRVCLGPPGEWRGDAIADGLDSLAELVDGSGQALRLPAAVGGYDHPGGTAPGCAHRIIGRENALGQYRQPHAGDELLKILPAQLRDREQVVEQALGILRAAGA